MIPVVDIDLILQQSDNAASSPLALLQKEQKAHEPLAFSFRSCLQPVSEAVPELPSTLSNASMDCQGTPVTMFTSISSSSHVQKKNQAASPNSLNTLPILVDSHSTPTITPAMEFSPSNIIYNEVQGSLVVDLLITSPKISGFESPSRFIVL